MEFFSLKYFNAKSPSFWNESNGATFLYHTLLSQTLPQKLQMGAYELEIALIFWAAMMNRWFYGPLLSYSWLKVPESP